ncbi:ROK family transcriptional regulator [Nocardia miyunensis]|uniref:ROK family transcriptional regulator n=1 Tax=Nocardia miyunensis TaxID=282684 RepID=UPI00082C22D4|nr:ROK family transcriptional regulator [Nocardia miyunensis]
MATDPNRPGNGRTSSGPGVRRGNVERLLEALRTHGPSSQAALARRTQLSPATVNSIVKDLRAEGTAEIQPVNGRESLVALVAQQGVMVSTQVNTDSITAALFDFRTGSRHDAALTRGTDFDIEGGGPRDVADLIHTLANEAGVQVGDLAGVGVAMQGPISTVTGTAASWARLQLPGWNDTPVAGTLGDLLGVPVVADNDANLAALAEWTWGAGRGCTDFLYVMCSAQIGGGIVLDGKVHRGGDGLAGEIGHIVLDRNGPVCFCGSRGCLTTVASERSILSTLAASGTIKHALPEVIDGAREGDPACQRVLYEAGLALGRALANTAKVIAPSVIAIGGLLGQAGPIMFESVRSSAEISSLLAVSPGIEFRAARIGADAALLGGLASVLTLTAQGISTLPEWTTRQFRNDYSNTK